jgi:hypothetical protein
MFAVTASQGGLIAITFMFSYGKITLAFWMCSLDVRLTVEYVFDVFSVSFIQE